MKKVLSTAFSVIVIIFAIIFISIIFSDDSSDNENKQQETTTSQNETEKATDGENKTFFSISATEQMNEKWKMTYKECQIKKELDPFTTAEEGTEFVVVFFEIENISDESQSFSIFWEEFYIDGVKTTQTLYGVLIDDAFPLTTVPVEPGRKANGYFLFQTSPDWKELEIIYDDSLSDEDEENVMKFILTKNAE